MSSRPLTFGSVCSGMEAASLAWGPLGWKCAFVSEIDKAPSALLAQRFPDVPNFWDMTKFEEWPDVAIDLLAGGTPCQSFSVAGMRKGLADPRGSLMLTYGAIAKRYRPIWLFWENVPGVLSSNEGRDFGSFLGMLAELGYGFAYRVLDAQFFGLAQRRKRVFVVGYLGDWRPPAAVLFERESLRGDSPPSREAREDAARGPAFGIDSDCFDRSGEGAEGSAAARSGLGIQEELCSVVRAKRPNAVAYGGNNTQGPIDVATARTAHAVPHGRLDFESETFIAEPYTLAIRGRGESHDLEYRQDGVANATQITSKANRSQPRAGEPCHPVTAEGHAPAIAFSCKDHGADAGELAPTLRAMGHAESHANAGGQLAIAFDARQSDVIQYGDMSGPLDTDQQTIGVLTEWPVRRLTPRECERLQGAPDDWTLVTYRGKPMADGPRYKMIGNSWAVPVVRWIGERIDLVRSEMDRAA